jgi:TPR repeat protein
MSFSVLRRWFTRADTPSVEGTSIPHGPAGAHALFLRGLKFASGEAMAQDYMQAAQCYAQAAARDHSLAQLNLATLYRQGLGVARDEAKSLMWLTKAAKLGNADAQYRLGIHQHLRCRAGSNGAAAEGRIEALKWVRLSAAQGNRGAERAGEFVALGMTRDEVAEGGSRAAAFMPGPGA